MICATHWGAAMTTGHGVAADREQDVSAAELTERVMRVAHLIRRTSMASLAPLDLTPAQSRALRTISKADPPIRMGELASTLGVVPRSATGLVDALQEAGLVARTVDPENRRSVLVTLTAAGRDMQQAMADARAAAGDGMFGRLTSGERRMLADLLGKVSAKEGQVDGPQLDGPRAR
jgi:DNA-binding MarR family transcriptional regulator